MCLADVVRLGTKLRTLEQVYTFWAHLNPHIVVADVHCVIGLIRTRWLSEPVLTTEVPTWVENIPYLVRSPLQISAHFRRRLGAGRNARQARPP